MTAKAARREYFEALAAFDRACTEFSKGMGALLEPAQPLQAPDAPQPLLANLGPRKPAKRASRAGTREQAKRAG
ncbi:hypothetical protein QTH90_05370 [Variovorax sp. J2P1-59]|uniref:hypothetical protein n=1 Tax=Variovorax flavidus TaxID=3053501 RepID=UPI002577B166|nr:hypothetical protein [Variovorax sp. J2P1-59]MDM0073799.1 hypothetical protein [Variovorax sp. J2P1-59]